MRELLLERGRVTTAGEVPSNRFRNVRPNHYFNICISRFGGFICRFFYCCMADVFPQWYRRNDSAHNDIFWT